MKNVWFEGMADYVKNVGESELPNTSIDVPNDNVKGKIYWDGTTFPNATLSKAKLEALQKKLSKAYYVCIEEFVLTVMSR